MVLIADIVGSGKADRFEEDLAAADADGA